jgi:hypothetical protein
MVIKSFRPEGENSLHGKAFGSTTFNLVNLNYLRKKNLPEKLPQGKLKFSLPPVGNQSFRKNIVSVRMQYLKYFF